MTQQWTTTPPTEPGWYWCMLRDIDTSIVIYVSNASDEPEPMVTYHEGEEVLELDEMTHWLGPLPAPLPPPPAT